MRFRLFALFLLGMLVAALVARPARASDPIERARLLHRAAREKLDDPRLETRMLAVQQLREAIELDPECRAADHWWLLGYLRELGRFDEEARQCYRNAQARFPNEAQVWLGLGRVYKREFLRTLDPDALHAAIAVLDSATRVQPPSSEPWLALCPLLYELPDTPRAAVAAEKALAGHPRLPAAALAAALMAWRMGDIERSDSLFRATVPRLAPDMQMPFDHPESYLGRTGAGTGLSALPDPDPTTPQNELLLEYWSRVAHAQLLFDDPLDPGLDARAETYIRYGPPARVIYDPLDVTLAWSPAIGEAARVVSLNGRVRLPTFPLHAQAWIYPELNMRIVLHDRSLNSHYTGAAARDFQPGSAPDPAVLARRQDLFAVEGGFAVLPTLPPRAQSVLVHETLAGFEGAVAGTRLVAFVQADRETLEARWSVANAVGHVVATGAHAMERSSCAAGVKSLAQFSAELPPGRYDVTVTARDGHGRRGLERRSITLAAAMGSLSLSDLVLCCGEPALMMDQGAIRLEPLAGAIATGSAPLTGYFEIVHLAAGADGLSHYTFEYRVEHMVYDRAAKRVIATGTFATWASREETFKGAVRRQFLSVPLVRVPPGEYRLTVVVHDTLAGTSDSRSAAFTRR